MLAMDVNDNAGCLNDRIVRAFFVGAPHGASSLLRACKTRDNRLTHFQYHWI